MPRNILEMTSDRWMETSYISFDEKREFRERSNFGNSHVVFDKNSEWGTEHTDEFNALDFPNGTLNHLSRYTEEKTGIPHDIAKVGIILGSILIGAKLLQKLEDY